MVKFGNWELLGNTLKHLIVVKWSHGTIHTYPSITKLSYSDGLSHTGQLQVGFLSFICRNNEASKHCRWLQVIDLHGVVILIFPNGHIRDTFKDVVAISQSPSSLNFSLTKTELILKHRYQRQIKDEEVVCANLIRIANKELGLFKIKW